MIILTNISEQISDFEHVPYVGKSGWLEITELIDEDPVLFEFALTQR